MIRPPLVYGPGVGANFKKMVDAVARGIPLPLGAVRNKRSLVFIANLVDLIVRCALSDAAPGKVFLVSDGQDFSTPELIKIIANAIGRKARLIPLPVPVLGMLGAATRNSQAVSRLVESLQVVFWLIV